jgi:hypothetical protein
MKAHSSADAATMWLGAAAIASLVFLFPLRELQLVAIPDAAIPVLIVAGLLAIAAGWLGIRALTVVAGAGLLLAAIGHLILHTIGAPLANDSNGSTFGLLLGLGSGLVALALVSRPQPS